MRIYVNPEFNHPERGDGGIRRVVEAQRRWLPRYGLEVTDNINNADLCAFHAGAWVEPPINIPVVTHTHGLYWEEYYGWSKGHQHINKDVIRNLKQADAVTAPSEWVARAIRRGMWLDPVVLYHGIDPEEWPLQETSEDYVLWNKTRVDPVCDPAPLNELVKRAPDIKFVSTFGNPAPNLTLLGNEPYDRAKSRVQSAGIYLCTSRETFGIGTLEAMASGVPILGFDYGGQREVVVHKEQGYLARPGDYDDLAVGLSYCREHREFLGRQARDKVLQEFTWEYWIGRYASLYRDLVLESRRRPKVSIIIPYYNLPEYVEAAVASAKQTARQIKHEILIVDDGSTEPLPQEVACDPGVFVIKNQVNKDLPETLDRGITQSRGEYVVLLDADNKLDNLDLLVEALDKDRSLDIAYGRMRVFRDEQDKGWVSGWPVREANLSEQLNHKNQIPSTALFRRRLFTWVGGYRTRCYTAEDADFWTRALAVGAKAKQVTPEVTLHYRDRSDSRSHKRKDWGWNNWYQWAGGQYRLITNGGPIFIHDKPDITVVIPVGPGHEKYLIDALDSVQAQSVGFYNWEALVVNDTGGRIKTRLPPWAGVIPNVRSGVSAARNTGTWLGTGEYVLYLDADDYLHPEALYHMYNVMKTCTCDKPFIYSDWYEAETGGKHIIGDYQPIDVLGRLPFPVTCLYNRSQLIDNHIAWDESFREGWEDWDFAIQCVTKGFCGVRVPAPLLHYRLNTGTLRTTAQSNKDGIKRKIRDKYLAYYTPGGKQVPGCGGCGGGRYPNLISYHSGATVFEGVDLDKETTFVQYNPPPDWTGIRTFVGRGTGNRYRFGTDEQNRVRRVFNADVQGLVDIGYFSPLSGAVGTLSPLQSGPAPDVPTESTVA
jgi:glycosyltransferase involved in cell wall biosynthesis